MDEDIYLNKYLEPDKYENSDNIEIIVPFNYKYLMISNYMIDYILAFLVIKYFWEQYINFRQLRRNLIKDMPE